MTTILDLLSAAVSAHNAWADDLADDLIERARALLLPDPRLHEMACDVLLQQGYRRLALALAGDDVVPCPF